MPRPIKPVTGGKTYTAASFEVEAMVSSKGAVHGVRVQFFDANKLPIPDGIVPKVAGVTQAQERAAVQALAATVANASETAAAWLLRAAAPYVALVYGITPS